MTVDLRINGEPILSSTEYTVTEDSTPVDPGDSSGGTGQITFGIHETPESRFLINKEASLSDDAQGTTVGVIRDMSSDDKIAGDLTITADSRLSLLNSDRVIAPYSGTFGGYINYLLSLFGITDGIVVDDTLIEAPVTLPGWEGNGWEWLAKNVCPALQIEASLVSNNVVIRPLRTRLAVNHRDASFARQMNSAQMALSVEVNYYTNEWREDAIAYPAGGWNPDVQILSVNAGEVSEYELETGASLLSFEEPVCVEWVNRHHESSSVYSVFGNDGIVIQPAQWADEGGRLDIAISGDSKELLVTLTGPINPTRDLSPYRIAMPSGTSDSYSSLRIVGTGVFQEVGTVTIQTGADPDRVSEEVGVTIENEAISTEEQAYIVGMWAAKRFAAPTHSITVTSGGINRVGDTGSYVYPTIADFNDIYSGQDIGDFNAEWAGKTIAEFNAYMRSLVQGDFVNQAFGNVAGARVDGGDAMFRIRTASIGPASLSYTADEDTTIADFNRVWAGATIADFNAEWAGKTLGEQGMAPLRRTN